MNINERKIFREPDEIKQAIDFLNTSIGHTFLAGSTRGIKEMDWQKQQLTAILKLNQITGISIELLVQRNRLEHNLIHHFALAGNSAMCQQMAEDPQQVFQHFPDLFNQFIQTERGLNTPKQNADEKIKWTQWLSFLSQLSITPK